MRIATVAAHPTSRQSLGKHVVSGVRLAPISLAVFFVLLLGLFGPVGGPAMAQGGPATGAGNAAAPQTYSDAVQVLAREQSVGEQYAVLLDRFGKKDMARYVQGIRRYAEAKADFDGLIEALKTDLIEGRGPDNSPKLADALRAAAEKRVAFTSFVSEEIGDTEGARAALPAVIAAVPALVKALTEAGIGIWREYRTAGKERRDAIRDQLDHLKWQAFADLAKG